MNRANLMAIASISLWCFSGICFRKGAEFLPPMVYLSLVTAIGVITACLIQVLRKKPLISLFKLPVKVVISGIPGITVYTVFLAYAFAIADSKDLGLINLLNYFWPMWLVILEIILLKRKPGLVPLCGGLLLGLSGLALAGGNFSLSISGGLLPHFLALSGGLFWAVYSVLLKVWSVPEEQSGTAFHFSICALTSLIIALLTGDMPNASNWSVSALLWILAGGIGPVGIAYYLWELGVKNGSVSLIASLSYFIPVGSSVLIGLIFRESLHWGLVPGALLIALGAYFVNKAVRT